jgi:hypothetical protein
MHMHMTMAWRADAAVDGLDIADKVGWRASIVKSRRHYDNRFRA